MWQTTWRLIHIYQTKIAYLPYALRVQYTLQIYTSSKTTTHQLELGVAVVGGRASGHEAEALGSGAGWSHCAQSEFRVVRPLVVGHRFLLLLLGDRYARSASDLLTHRKESTVLPPQGGKRNKSEYLPTITHHSINVYKYVYLKTIKWVRSFVSQLTVLKRRRVHIEPRWSLNQVGTRWARTRWSLRLHSH